MTEKLVKNKILSTVLYAEELPVYLKNYYPTGTPNLKTWHFWIDNK